MDHVTPETFPPIHGTHPAVLEWLQTHDATALADVLRYSVAFSEQGIDPGAEELRYLWDTGGWVSWLGGPAVPVPGLVGAGDWPHADDGTPLTHVATIHLADVDGAIDRAGKATWPAGQLREGMPTAGILQVFHDLRTFGVERADAARGAWAVVVSDDPAYSTPEHTDQPAGERPELVAAPAPGNEPSPVCQLILPFSAFTLPSSLDVAPELADRAGQVDELTEALQLAWMAQRQVGGTYAIPTTHAYGHGSHGNHHATLDVLPAVLPLVTGDEYRLVLEIDGWTILEGWFGDAGSLEVWMRQSDLAAARFENAWCLIRTD